MNEYLHTIKATENILYDEFNLHIWNLLSKKKIVLDSDMKKIGIFGFQTVGSQQYTYIFLKYYDDYEILTMTDIQDYNAARDYSEILDDLQKYFGTHPDIDKRLLPFYNKAVYDVYVDNTQTDQLGPWFNWYDTKQMEYIKD